MNRTSFISSLCAVFALNSPSQEHAEMPSPALVEFDFMVVQMPEKLALPLVPQLRDDKRSEKAVAEILDLVAANKAKLVGWPIVATKHGQRAVVEQVEEFRYVTEYDPAKKEKRIENYPKDSETPGAPIVPVDPKDAAPAEEKPERIRTIYSESNGIPRSFETRNVGVTLEIEPVIHPDGRAIDVSLVPQHISLLEMRRIEIEDKTSGKKTVVEQPVFLTNKLKVRRSA